MIDSVFTAVKKLCFQDLFRGALVAVIVLAGMSQIGCMEETRAGVGGDGGMRGGQYTPYRGQYPQHPKETKEYMRHALNN